MENKQDIGKAFRDKLAGYNREPADAVWEGINAGLRQKKRGGFRMPLWGRATAIVLGIILLAVATHPLYKGYLPEIIIKMPGDKPQTVTGTGNGSDNAQPSGDAAANPAIGNTQNSTTTAAAPRSQDAAAVPTADDNAVTSNTGAGVNNNSAAGASADNDTPRTTHKAANSTGTASGKNNIRANNNTDANTKMNAATNRSVANSAKGTATTANGSQAKASALTHKNNGVASNGANGTAAKRAKHTATPGNPVKAASNGKAPSKTTTDPGIHTAVTANAAAGKNNTAGTLGETQPDSNNAKSSNTLQSSQPVTTTATPANTGTPSGYRAKNNKDTNILYSAGNFPTITKAVTDSLVLAQKALDYKESKERTFAQNPYTPLQDTLTGGDGYAKGFYVYAFVAPSNYKFGEGTSLIDPSLNNHGTSAETSTNFGAYFGYEFSSQLTLRAGVSSTKIVQNTGNVTLGANYSGVDYANGMSNTAANVALGGGPVTLRQNTTFIEVPVEATYALFGTRADLYFKGGFSGLFLQDNELHAQNSQGSVLLGSLNHTKDFSFSGNMGFGFYYKFTRELQLNVEPGFKYYFNTFDNVSPYSFNVQAGLLYRF